MVQQILAIVMVVFTILNLWEYSVGAKSGGQMAVSMFGSLFAIGVVLDTPLRRLLVRAMDLIPGNPLLKGAVATLAYFLVLRYLRLLVGY